MFYVYLLQSKNNPDERYTGYTTNLKNRLKKHNEGGVPHTAQHKPWNLVTYLGFESSKQALAFERYLKSGSGRAFANRHLWPEIQTNREA